MLIFKIVKYHWGIIALFLLMFESIISNINGKWDIYRDNEFDSSFSSMKYQYMYYDSSLKTILIIISVLLLLYGGLKNYRNLFKVIPTYVLFLWSITIVIGLLFTLEGFLYHNESSMSFGSFFRYALNPMFFIFMFAVIVGSNNSDMLIIKKYTIYIGFIFLLLGFLSMSKISDFLFVIGRSPLLVFMENAFWSFLIYALMNNENLKLHKYILLLIGFLICAYFSLLLVSRSWIIQSIFAILLTSFNFIIGDNKRKNFKIIFFIIFIGGVILQIINSMSDLVSFDLLLNKMGQDTRSSQYISVFNQVSTSTFLFGGGMFYTWIDEHNIPYRYIDNQSILLCYRYGIIPFVTYYILILLPAIKLCFCNKRQNKPIFWFVFIWCMAINGLSVFNTLNWDYMNLLLIIISGHCWYLLKCNKR